MSDLIIMGNPNSTYVRTTRMVCEEKGAPYALESADPGTPENLELHPFGKIPAMRHGDFALFESVAMSRYIDDNWPGTRLVPEEGKSRALVNQWISAICDYVYADVVRKWVVPYAVARRTGEAPDMDVVATGVAAGRRHLEILDAAYGDRSYLVGDRPTLADLYLAPIMNYVKILPESPEILAKLPNLMRGEAAMVGRPSYQRTLPPALESEAAE